jgi:hypothetical protein
VFRRIAPPRQEELQALVERIAERIGRALERQGVGPNGISDVRNNLTGYTIVRGESHEAAAALFLDHPHFSIFPGDGVEVMEVLAIPGAG